MLTRKGRTDSMLSTHYRLRRLAIRSLRLGCAALALVAAVFVYKLLPPIWNRPLALLTIGDLLATLAFWACALAILGPVLWLAFSPEPGDQDKERFIKEWATNEVYRRESHRREMLDLRRVHKDAFSLGAKFGRILGRRR